MQNSNPSRNAQFARGVGNNSSGHFQPHHNGHTFAGDVNSLKFVQSKLDKLVCEFHSPNREDGFQQMLLKMEQVRKCQQELCAAHFDLEKPNDEWQTKRDMSSSDKAERFAKFDKDLSGRLVALSDAIKNLHPNCGSPNHEGKPSKNR